MYLSIWPLDVTFNSTETKSKSSHESKVCIRLHSCSELSLSSVTSFTCCDLHVFAKWFSWLYIFLKNLPIEGHYFKWPSEKALLHLLRCLFSVFVFEMVLPSICLLLYWSSFGGILFRLLFHTLFIDRSSRVVTCRRSACDYLLKHLFCLLTLFEFQRSLEYNTRKYCFER